VETDFEIIGEVTAIETIAIAHGIRDLRRLMRSYGDAKVA